MSWKYKQNFFERFDNFLICSFSYCWFQIPGEENAHDFALKNVLTSKQDIFVTLEISASCNYIKWSLNDGLSICDMLLTIWQHPLTNQSPQILHENTFFWLQWRFKADRESEYDCWVCSEVWKVLLDWYFNEVVVYRILRKQLWWFEEWVFFEFSKDCSLRMFRASAMWCFKFSTLALSRHLSKSAAGMSSHESANNVEFWRKPHESMNDGQ